MQIACILGIDSDYEIYDVSNNFVEVMQVSELFSVWDERKKIMIKDELHFWPWPKTPHGGKNRRYTKSSNISIHHQASIGGLYEKIRRQ